MGAITTPRCDENALPEIASVREGTDAGVRIEVYVEV
jgi:hypothetical protein